MRYPIDFVSGSRLGFVARTDSLFVLTSYVNFIMIGLLLRETLDRLRVRLNMYLVYSQVFRKFILVPVQVLLQDDRTFSFSFSFSSKN